MKDTLILENKNTVDVELLKKSININSLKPAMDVLSESSKTILELYKDSIKDNKNLNATVNNLKAENSTLNAEINIARSKSPTVNLRDSISSRLCNIDNPVIQQIVSEEAKSEIESLREEVNSKSNELNRLELDINLHSNELFNLNELHSTKLKEREIGYNNNMFKLENRHSDEISELKKSYDLEIEKLKLIDVTRNHKINTAIAKLQYKLENFKYKRFFKKAIAAVTVIISDLGDVKFATPSYIMA